MRCAATNFTMELSPSKERKVISFILNEKRDSHMPFRHLKDVMT